MRLSYRRLVGALGSLLAGCTVGPNYTAPPPTVTPVAYKEAPLEGSAEAGMWRKARPDDAAARGKW
jgi:hypothetical protein